MGVYSARRAVKRISIDIIPNGIAVGNAALPPANLPFVDPRLPSPCTESQVSNRENPNSHFACVLSESKAATQHLMIHPS